MESAFVIQKNLECSCCGEYVTYYCITCKSNLCGECKRKHINIFNNTDTGNHYVVVYRGKFKKCIEESCEQHPEEIYKQFCKDCEIPVCKACKRNDCHKNHTYQDLKKAYLEKQDKYLRTSIANFQNRIIPQYRGIRNEISREKEVFEEEAGKIVEKMENNAQSLKHSIERTVAKNKRALNRGLKAFSKEEKLVDDHITELQSLLSSYEQSVNKPAEFLFLSKERPLPDRMRKFAIPNVPSFVDEVSITEDGVEKLLGKLTMAKEEIKPSSKHLYRLKSKATKEISVPVSVENIQHISCVGVKNWVWISGGEYLILVNKTGEKLNEYEINPGFGCHSVASDCRLYYLGKNGNICTDIKKDVIKASQKWKICSIYCSCKDDSIIVGMKKGKEAKLMQYDGSKNPTATIPYDNEKEQLFISPDYITQNDNGDIVVSDSKKHAVVVTDCGGNHRFTFTGNSKLNPRGVCTDILSNILVCNIRTERIHILSKDGTFIQYLQTDDQDFGCPFSLCYDLENHLLWIGGSGSNMLTTYRYLEPHF